MASNQVPDPAVGDLERRLHVASIDEDVDERSESTPVVLVSSTELREGINHWKFCLLGRVFSTIQTTANKLSLAVNRMWFQYGTVDVVRKEDDLFAFRFDSEQALNYVLNEAPWRIDGCLICFQEWNPSEEYKDLNWTYQPMWIQLKRLPNEFMNPSTPIKISELAFKVMKMDPPSGIPRRGHVRIWIDHNIDEPMYRGVYVANAKREKEWIMYYFERQPSNICNRCYVLNHSQANCQASARKVRQFAEKVFSFGSPFPHYGEPVINGPHRVLNYEGSSSRNATDVGDEGSISVDQQKGTKRARAEAVDSNTISHLPLQGRNQNMIAEMSARNPAGVQDNMQEPNPFVPMDEQHSTANA